MKSVPALGIALSILFCPIPSPAQGSNDSTGNVALLAPVHSPVHPPAELLASGNFTVSPSTDTLGNVAVGTSHTDSVTVTNTAKSTLTIGSVVSTNPAFTVGPSSATIAGNRSRKFGITFAPTTAGLQSSAIIFNHSGTTTPDTVRVWGTGLAPVFTVDHPNVDFGDVPISTAKADSVTVSNTGSSPLIITNITSSNANFAASPTSGTINPGAAMKFRITFAPPASGSQFGGIIFRHNAVRGSDTVTVTGAGTAFSVNRRTLSFSHVLIGSSAQDSVFVTNTGSTMLTISSVTTTRGEFTVSPISTAILPTATRLFTVTFTPSDTALLSASLIFTHSAFSSPDSVALTGSGYAVNPGFSVAPASVAFDTVRVGSLKTDSVVVTNTGSKTLRISSVLSTNGAFTVSPAGDSLQPGEQARFFITFTPASGSSQTGYIVFSHNAPGSPDSVAVSGLGTVPGFSLNRRNAAFGFVRVGDLGRDSVIVTNTGSAPLIISSVTSSSGLFVVHPTSASIAPDKSQTFTIGFLPADTLTYAGTIVFTHSAASGHDTVVVSGSGTLARYSVSRRSLAFGYVTIGAAKQDTMVVTNAGASMLIIDSVTSTNTAFSVVPSATALSPGQSQIFHVTFNPSNTSAQIGFLLFSHNARNTPDTVDVSGNGTVAVFGVNKRNVLFGQVPVGATATDSVTVTNNGASTLLITDVTSDNPVFSVAPESGAITVGARATFTIEFTPLNGSTQNGNIVFVHIASSSPDTIRVSGIGSLAGIALDRDSIAFGPVQVGGVSAESVAVTNTGATTLLISSATSDNANFTVSPSNASIPPAAKSTFTVTCTPHDTIPQYGHIVFAHNALGRRDTVAVSATGVAALPAPTLLAPSDGTVGQIMPLVLQWSTVPGALGYLVQVATDPSFTNVVLSDPTIVLPTRQVTGLPGNTMFYWRVSSRNAAGSGPASTPWTLKTAPSAHISQTIPFSGDLSSSSYKLFGLPGVGARTVGSILGGSRNVDWRLLRDRGRDTTYPAYYEDLSADSMLRTGEGYWLLSKSDLNISRSDTLPALSADGTFPIAIHPGWNIISDPFTVSVQKTAILAANVLPTGTLFWDYNGTTTSSSGTTIDPFKGYYFFNDSVDLAMLRIPYPFSSTVSKKAEVPGMEWRVELEFDGDQSVDRDNYIGIATVAGPGRNVLDQHEPPLFFDHAFLYFPHPEWDPRYPRFATDIRSAIDNGQTWDLEVWNPRGGTGRIVLHGVESVPDCYRLVLFSVTNTTPVDLRLTSSYAYETLSSRMRFKLLIGTEEFVHTELARLLPQTFALFQNYPNPFNPRTVISAQWPVASVVRLAVYDILGREVSVLAAGQYPAGTFSFSFDGRGLASGTYFCRLTAGDYTAVKKMTLVK